MILQDHEGLETLIQAVDLYAASLRELIQHSAQANVFHRLPSELQTLYEQRIDRCVILRQQFYERQVELHLDAEKPVASKAAPRKRKAVKHG